MSILDKDSFFTVDVELILVGIKIPYDIYINSSKSERERFVKIFAEGGSLTKEEIYEYKRKYFQLYVLEAQRNVYVKSLVKSSAVSDVKKTEVIKDSAITYLANVFEKNKDDGFSTEFLDEAIQGCKESVESMVDVIQDYNVHQIQELIASLSFHDFYTFDHSINVAMYCISMYRLIRPNAKKESLVVAGLGGLLHDLGKINIPTHIINNPGKLSDEEFAIIKTHPKAGEKMLEEQQHKNSDEELDYETIKRVVAEHHENYDGSGYPLKLKGDDIHVLARIAAMADFFDAITTKRSYHEVLSTEAALGVMSRSVGKKLDPDLFEIFREHVNRLGRLGAEDKSSHVELPIDFDPCQPHEHLPFCKTNPHVISKEVTNPDKKSDVGKVKIKHN